jgi:hypothetical protein
MIFNWSDYFYKRGPNYQQAYTDGFNDCKSECLKQIKSLEKHIERLEAYRKYTTTVEVHYRISDDR